MKVVGAGLSGLIGRPLASQLVKKYELLRLVREITPQNNSLPGKGVIWKPPFLGDWSQEIDGAYAVINLSGESVADKRWTSAQKKELRNSRIQTTKALVDAIGQAKTKPKVFINASAIGYYGPRDDSPLDEKTPLGTGFLADLCQEWEGEALRTKTFSVRTVLLRTGIVLAKEGGALAKMLPPFKMGLGGSLGNGRQFMSWIHIEDEVNAILKTLEDPSINGAVNLTAPHAVSMKEFAVSLGKTLKRPAFFPVPGTVLKVLLGDMSEMFLTGQNVRPEVLLRSGFTFRFPSLGPALSDLIQKSS